jgi:long-chain acyl-CoA synthetase
MPGDQGELKGIRAHVSHGFSGNRLPLSDQCCPWLSSYPDEVPATVDIDRYPSVVAILEQSFKRNPDEIAYSCMGHELSYRELDSRSRDLAAYFQKVGLVAGDRLAVMLPNILQSPITVAAALRAGLVVVNVNPLYTSRELRLQLIDSGAKGIVLLNIAAARLQNVLAETDVDHTVITQVGDMHKAVTAAAINAYVRYAKRRVPRFKLAKAVGFRRALYEGKRAPFRAPRIEPDNLAVLQYTGGTTGTPKGAMLLHRNLVGAMLSCEAWLEPVLKHRPINEQMTTVCALPLYHVFAFVNCSLIAACKGGRSLLIPDARDTSSIVRALRGRRFHSFTGVNTLFNALIEHPEFATLDFSELRISVGGGMEVSSKTAQRWFEITGCPIAEGYGLTETTSGVCCNRLDLDAFTGKLGLPMPGSEIRILDSEGRQTPRGVPGEISVRSLSVMKGYWNQPEETRAVMTDDGFLRSGDLGTMDEHGFVRFLGRQKDVIVVSGFKVYPIEIESVLKEISGVIDCAAVGAPDRKSGQAIWLFVVADRVGRTEIEQRCRQSLAAYKQPAQIVLLKSLPVRGPGKIDRIALRSIAADQA